jgi:predicted Zn-dependent protease with MMP-like domain
LAVRPRRRFERLVERALADLPPFFQERLYNVDIIIKRRPSREDLDFAELEPGETLYGFYHGVPLTDRGADYGLVLPDKITIFQEPLEMDFADDRSLTSEVRKTVLHEIAHHFGISDEELTEMGLD